MSEPDNMDRARDELDGAFERLGELYAYLAINFITREMQDGMPSPVRDAMRAHPGLVESEIKALDEINELIHSLNGSLLMASHHVTRQRNQLAGAAHAEA